MSRHLRGLGVALLGAVLASTASPALAKPPAKAGAPTGLAASATKDAAGYDVAASWNAPANATRYVVKLATASGTLLDQATVTTTSWRGYTTQSVGTALRVSVRAYNGTRAGGTAVTNFALPDMTAPLASYTVVREDSPNQRSGNVWVDLTALSDDLSATGTTQTIDWNDGSLAESWPTSPLPSRSSQHVFDDSVAKVFHPVVTVKDQFDNARTYTLAIAVNDSTAPLGSFEVTKTAAWAKWTRVSLSPVVAVSDNASAAADVVKVVNWGDGTPVQQWTSGPVPTHVYATAGSYSPSVTLVDEAGNESTPAATSQVVVSVDTVKPTLRLTLPTTRKAYVSSWVYLKGRATDAQTGVRNVTVRAIEKRGTSWYAYRPAANTWVKAATKAQAWSRTGVRSVKTTTAGNWVAKLGRLTKGTLIYRTRAFDNRGNASAFITKKVLITRR